MCFSPALVLSLAILGCGTDRSSPASSSQTRGATHVVFRGIPTPVSSYAWIQIWKGLTPAQRLKAAFPDEVRVREHHVLREDGMPPDRGISVRELSPEQRKAVQDAFLAWCDRAVAISDKSQADSQEANAMYLRAKDNLLKHGVEAYFITFYGDPDADELFSWYLQGPKICTGENRHLVNNATRKGGG